jgi:hypothetical protein
VEIKAINFGGWGSDGFPGTDAQLNEYISRIKAMGSNTIWLDYQKSYDIVTGKQVAALYPNSTIGANTAMTGPSGVEAMIVKSLANGLTPVLSPHTNAWNSATQTGAGNMNVWNTDINKIDVKTFFAEYQKEVVEAATLSQKYGLPLLSIGIEMNVFDTAPFRSYWLQIIDAVHAVYSGKLTYGALTNVFSIGVASPYPDARFLGFADKLDYVALSVYPYLGYGKTDASVSELFQSAYDTKLPSGTKIASWQKYFDDIYTQYGKKIIVQETGFEAFDGAAGTGFVTPSSFVGKTADFQEQSDATFAWMSFLANLSSDKYLGQSIFGVNPANIILTDGHGNFTGTPAQYDYFLKYYQLNGMILGKPVENTISAIYHDTNSSTALPGLSFSGSGTLLGTLGCDTFTPSGVATIKAGLGIDKVIFSGKAADYTITHNIDGSTTVKNSMITDILTDVERLQFTDKTIALDVNGNGGQIYRLYQAAFNRTPDKQGLGDWLYAMDHGTDLLSVSLGFIQSVEFQTKYQNQTAPEIITHLYQNVLHRDPEQAGLDYWVNQLTSGAQSGQQILVGFSESNENQANLIGVIQNGFEYYQHA